MTKGAHIPAFAKTPNTRATSSLDTATVADSSRESVIADFVPTASAIQQQVDIVLSMPLSDELKSWIARYGDVGQRGGPYLWSWCRRGVEVVGMSCVPVEQRQHLADTKFFGAMLDVLLDDIADKGGDPVFLEHLIELYRGDPRTPRSAFSPEQQAYSRFTEDLCAELQRRARQLPRYAEFEALLDFDYAQMFNAMRYSNLLNANPELLNLAEHDHYLPHNMYMVIFSTLDLMSSPEFDRAELSVVREAALKAQYMGRIGNLVTTWQREIGERDFSSGVFALAVSKGLLTVKQLESGSPQWIEDVIQSGKNEPFFLTRWQDYRRDLLKLGTRIKSVDLAALVNGLEKLLCLHLGSRGSK